MNEFALIKHYFDQHNCVAAGDALGIVRGIGDDCAVLAPDADGEIVITTDTLVAGVHFPEQANPGLIAQRALRVNLSDIAAMGATPRWFLLALTLPALDNVWLEAFSSGLRAVSDIFNCPLVGGDTTRGPLTITITMVGGVPTGTALLRSGACVGDRVYVTGFLGDAAAGLGILKDTDFSGGGFDNDGLENNSAGQGPGETSVYKTNEQYLLGRFWQPSPRISEGLLLRDYASAAIDISDGLLADLGHICEASSVGAELTLASIPLSVPLTEVVTQAEATRLSLTAGDDYELCFTVPPEKVAGLESRINTGLLSARNIGEIVPGEHVKCLDSEGLAVDFPNEGYQHF